MTAMTLLHERWLAVSDALAGAVVLAALLSCALFALIKKPFSRKAAVFLVACFLLPLSLSGCWDYKDLPARAFVRAVGVDYDSDNEAFNIVLSDETSASGAGGAFGLAMRDAAEKFPKDAYLGQVKLIIFGEGILDDGGALKAALAALMADREVNRAAVVIRAESAAKVFEDDKAVDYFKDYIKHKAKNPVTLERLDKAARGGGAVGLPEIEIGEGK